MTSPALIDPIVLGHNPFFGVDHLSRERGARRDAQFESRDAILAMLHEARAQGVSGLMMSTHPRASGVATALRADARLRDEMRLYPLLPYVNKYVRASNEKGLVNVVLDQLRGGGLGQKLALLAKGGLGYLRKDAPELLRTLIRMELMPLQGLRLQAVFLHDVLTDLALAFDLRGIFELYHDEIERRCESIPAFATKNLPLLLERFRAYGFERPVVLSHFNRIGFSMNPDRETCERCLGEHTLDLMAMGTLASGYLAPDEAYRHLGGLRQAGGRPGLQSVVVGVSTAEHARETFACIHRHLFPTGERAREHAG